MFFCLILEEVFGVSELRQRKTDSSASVMFVTTLDGILYVDRADSVFINQAWMDELKQYEFTRPDWW